jgi:signal transduction histidine kinase
MADILTEDAELNGSGTVRSEGETLSGRRISELLGELHDRIDEVIGATRAQMNVLLTSMMAVSSGLDLDATLSQLTRTAIELVDAGYGALGVFGPGGELGDFIFILGDGPEQLGRGSVLADKAKQALLDDLTAHPFSAGFTSSVSSTRRYLGVPVFARGEIFGRLYLTEKESGEGLTADDEIVVRALAAAAGIAVENSRLYETGQRHRRWSSAVEQVTTALLSGGDSEQALQLIATHARQLTGADYTFVALPDDLEEPPPDEGTAAAGPPSLRVTVAVGTAAEGAIGRRIPISGSTAGAVFADRQARSVPELAFDLSEGLGIDFGPALALPLGLGDERLAGVLLTVRRPGALTFDDLELQMVSLFAGQAMLALERTTNQSARREIEALAERDRIAQDLHDHVIQRLFAVGLAMETTHQLSNAPSVTRRLGDHVDQVYQVIDEIRSAIFDLQTQPAHSQLRTTLHQVITDLTADSSLQTTIRMSGPLNALPDDLVKHVRAVVREAVSNVVRHADASDLSVTISVDDNVVIDVTDDGVGIAETVATSGLHNLQIRATAVGGTCTAGRIESGGTKLLWAAPLIRPAG